MPLARYGVGMKVSRTSPKARAFGAPYVVVERPGMVGKMTEEFARNGGQCTATAKHTIRDGAPRRCLQPAVPGATVCKWHGGNTPQVQAKARQRLLEALDAVAGELAKMALDPELEPAIKLRAMQDLMTRADLVGTSKSKVEVEGTMVSVPSEVAEMIAAERERRKALKDARGDSNVIHTL